MAGNLPTHKIFIVEDRGQGNDSFWHDVGGGWAHKDGKGIDIMITAGMALTGRIVLREVSERPETAPRRDRTARSEPRR